MYSGVNRMSKLISIHWPIVFVTSIVLYVLMLVTLPFNSRTSMVFLFLLIAFWSRLPGVGIPSPMFALYHLDLVDLFSLIVAVNVGGLAGAMFALFGNIVSRAAGIFPTWQGVMNDAISQAIICLFIPIIHAYTGSIFTSMVIYTIIRRLGFIVGYFVYPQAPFFYYFLVLWPGSTFISLTVNGFYSRYFGNYFNGLMQSGVKFNFVLFVIATVIMFTMWRLMIGKRTHKYMHKGVLLKTMFGKLRGKDRIIEKDKEDISDERLVLCVKKDLGG